MRLLYADSSALGRAFIPGEPEHRHLRTLLREGPEPVVTSELAVLEVSRALFAARRGRRLRSTIQPLARFDREVGPDHAIKTLTLDQATVFPKVRALLEKHPLGTLDAMHLAVALLEAGELVADQELVFVTRDRIQRKAAVAENLAVA